MKQIIAENGKDVATLIDSMPINILNLIDLNKEKYQLISHQKHRVQKDSCMKIEAHWTCQKVKGANKCLSGLDNQGRVNAEVKFFCADCED